MNHDSFISVFDKSFELDANLKANIGLLGVDDYHNIRAYKSLKINQIKMVKFDALVVCKRKLSNFDLSVVKNLDIFDKVEFIDDDFFAEESGLSLQKRIEILSNKIVLTTSNDIQFGANPLQTLKNFQLLYLSCKTSFFLGWDWDNHHHLAISSIYSMCSDIYFPSHRANDYELSKTSAYKFHMPSSAYQWSKSFLLENFDLIVNSEREVDVFGKFVMYGIFGYRNQIIHTLNKKIPEICFLRNDQGIKSYLEKSDYQKLEEWTSNKWHWVVPTLNDLSTRVFDSLIAGVGVILPIDFKSFYELKDLDDRDVIWYNTLDILDPNRVLLLANEKFKNCGKDGVIRRHRFALDFHN